MQLCHLGAQLWSAITAAHRSIDLLSDKTGTLADTDHERPMMSDTLTDPPIPGKVTTPPKLAQPADPLLGPTRIKPVSRKEAVRIEIRRAIISGTLTPGDKLTETQLASSLGVSRPTIREALNALAEEGFVTKEPYRGLRVAVLSSADVHDMAHTRNALDMVAIDAILADDSGEKFAQIDESWAEYEQGAFDPDPVVQHDSHLRLHKAIWQASGNDFLMKLWPVTAAQLTLAFAEDRRRHPDPNREYLIHRKLVTAIRTQDRETIEAAVVEHTLSAAKQLHDLLKAEGK